MTSAKVNTMSSFPLFPDQASVGAQRVDAVYFGLLAISAFFALLIFVLLIYFALKYRAGRNVDRVIRRTDYLKLEMTWIIIPLLISFAIFGWAAKVYFDLRTPPEDALEIYVVGKQWMWKVQHPNGVRENNELHVPIGRTVKLTMTSQDVIHSFFIPAFRIKQDVLPGRYTSQWFKATKVGEYHLFCAEYCGVAHSAMVTTVEALPAAEFQAWLESGATVDPIEQGATLAQQHGCLGCHSVDGSPRVGPTFKGLAGSPRQVLQSGKELTVTADTDYLLRSLREPAAEIVAGYPPIMPVYAGLPDEEVTALITWLETLR